MPLESGARPGHYEVISPIGAGDMGEVYKARDPRLNRTVAIKVLPAHITERADVWHRAIGRCYRRRPNRYAPRRSERDGSR